jgi:hypothetical protein
MEFHGIYKDFMGFQPISWHFLEFHRISRDFIGFSMDFMTFHGIS